MSAGNKEKASDGGLESEVGDEDEGRDEDELAGIKKGKSTTDKDEIIKKIMEKQQKK